MVNTTISSSTNLTRDIILYYTTVMQQHTHHMDYSQHTIIILLASLLTGGDHGLSEEKDYTIFIEKLLNFT